MNLKKIFSPLNVTDFVVVIFYLLLTITALLFHASISNWYWVVAISVLLIAFIFFIANLHLKKNTFWIRQIHYWYLPPMVLLSYKLTNVFIKPLRPIDYDAQLIAIDRFIFGTDPTVWMHQFAHPIITEILQFVYFSFYFLPIILAISLWLNNKQKESKYVMFAVVLGFLLSYFGYFMVPGVGPRFTLHDFSQTDVELPGIFAAEFFRNLVNVGGGAPPGSAIPMETVQRDVFPSGHTLVTLITMILAFKFNDRFRYLLLVTGILLIISTVYLRYHYVIDLVASLVWFAATMWSAKHINNWWNENFSNKKIL